jgi:Na+-translocating ferredoxin:NAD+ oxidoreductase subunit C
MFLRYKIEITMAKLKTFNKGGVHPHEHKRAALSPIVVLDPPKQAVIPLSQSLGAPSVAVVNKGDTIRVGQLIAKGEAFISSNIHSSVSGKVSKIDESIETSGYRKLSVIIDVEGDEWMEDIDRSTDIKRTCSLTREEIIAVIKDKGIVGLGGATFPTHVKYMIPKDKTPEYLIINAVECEPMLTADHRLMLEKGTEMLIGTEILMKALGVKNALIGIENNKPDAIEHLSRLVKDFPGITVHGLKVQYPQGAEKQLINALLGREVPSGKLPIEVGCVVNNSGTAFAVYEAVQKNKPLIDRIVTVTGPFVKNPGNFLVRIGTPVSDLIEKAGGIPEDTGKIINGGPMMGKSISSVEVPVTKGTSGILLFPDARSNRMTMVNCIRCARCSHVCPMGLEPYLLAQQSEFAVYDGAEKHAIMDCIECGSCQYTCPSGRPLLDYIRLGKNKVGMMIRNRTSKN